MDMNAKWKMKIRSIISSNISTKCRGICAFLKAWHDRLEQSHHGTFSQRVQEYVSISIDGKRGTTTKEGCQSSKVVVQAQREVSAYLCLSFHVYLWTTVKTPKFTNNYFKHLVNFQTLEKYEIEDPSAETPLQLHNC